MQDGWMKRARQVGSLLWRGVLLGVLGAGILSGCAVRLTAIPVSERARAELGEDNGIPYYAPRPYLLVTRNIELTDDVLVEAGVVPGEHIKAGPAGRPGALAPDAVSTNPTAPGASGEDARDSSTEARSERDRILQAVPTYDFKVIYLPDLTRQYALQQRGGVFSNVTLRYELEGGWMFKGTEIKSDTKAPEAITATTSGIGNILGASVEQIVASLFPIPSLDAGVSGVGDAGGMRELDLTPRIWLFEIGDGPRGTLFINTERPFFEWPPPDARHTLPLRPPVSDGRDPSVGDLRHPTPLPSSSSPAPVPSPRTVDPAAMVPPTPPVTAPSTPASPQVGPE